MTCPHCSRKDIAIGMQADEIRRLKRELGHRRKAAETGAVMAAFDLTQVPADILINLYAAGGRLVRKEALMVHVGEESMVKTLDTHIHRIRKGLGSLEAIETVPGVGYKATIPTISRVMAVLEPPELQDARG